MKQRKAWTKQEDQILRQLRQERAQKKWSVIAKKMEEQFSISGRSGKQCRQRYHNHLDSSIKTSEWTHQEERILYEMHDQVGNRWSVISHKLPGRTDNCVKNHFYSKLRKAVRRINKIILENYKKEYKQIKTSLLYKIIQTSQSKFKVSSMVDEEIADFCTEIKNKLYYFQQNFVDTKQEHIQALKILIQDILNFGKNDKRVKIKRKSSGAGKDLLHPLMYLKKARSISQYSQSEISSSSRFIQSSSYGQQSSIDQNLSIGHKSMNQISKKQTNPSRTLTSNTNLRLTRSRSKQQTFSSNKSPECFSDDANVCAQKRQFLTFTGQNFLQLKPRQRNPSFQHQKSDWSQKQIQQMLQQDKIVEERSSGSNKFSKNSRYSRSQSNSQNKSHVNLYFEDSQFEMRILSPRMNDKMYEQELFGMDPMQMQIEQDHYSADSIRTFNLGGRQQEQYQNENRLFGQFEEDFEQKSIIIVNKENDQMQVKQEKKQDFNYEIKQMGDQADIKFIKYEQKSDNFEEEDQQEKGMFG